MGPYNTICADNEKLYGELESLTLKIKAYKQSDLETDATELKNKKECVGGLININLDNLQEIWDAKSHIYRNATLKRHRNKPSKLERKIIDSYYRDPDQTLDRIGIKFNVKTPTVSSVITKLLNKQFIGY
ncbi:hypothetical protein [Mucilaginibacter sp. L196]|uniref:hypothetical protein n=1 Tax=Mucilaginibacter sp. L196 TaxID=1641870 RepID=UPI00131EB4D9|nr:hypothetical protein [Mucilaginibacter sp. L196]